MQPYYNPIKKEYFLLKDIDVICAKCKSELEVGVLRIGYVKLNGKNKGIIKQRLYCENCCGQRLTDFVLLTETKLVYIVDELPKGSFPIPIRAPDLTNINRIPDNDLTVFDGERLHKGEMPQVIDHTMISGRAGKGELLIEDQAAYIQSLEYKDNKLMNDKELISFLIDIKKAQPVIEHKEIKLITNAKKN